MPSKIDVGQMRHRVILQTLGSDPPVSGPGGGEVTEWVTVGGFWAFVEPLVGRELFQAQQFKQTISTRVTMRNVGPIKATDRLIFEETGEVLNIESIIRVDNRDAYYQILATVLAGAEADEAP